MFWPNRPLFGYTPHLKYSVYNILSVIIKHNNSNKQTTRILREIIFSFFMLEGWVGRLSAHPPQKPEKPIKVGRILYIYRKNSTKKNKENKTKQRKTMYSKQLYTITILTLNKSIQAVQLIY